MKITIWLALLLVTPFLATAGERYPNELEGFSLYEKYCSGLEPLKSSKVDVRKKLGEPMKDKSGPLVLWYERDGWIILVYICTNNGHYPKWLAGNAVKSIDFIPKEPITFKTSALSKAFNRQPVRAADAAWDEFSDAHGLVYEVYTSKPPYGKKQAGDLNRVSYRAAPHKTITMQYFQIQRLLDETKASKAKKTDKPDAGDGK